MKWWASCQGVGEHVDLPDMSPAASPGAHQKNLAHDIGLLILMRSGDAMMTRIEGWLPPVGFDMELVEMMRDGADQMRLPPANVKGQGWREREGGRCHDP